MPSLDLNTAFDIDKADPEADPDRFYQQARVLGLFAERVYPQRKTVEEQMARDREVAARIAYRKTRPWWKPDIFIKDAVAEREAWRRAISDLNEMTRKRMEDDVEKLIGRCELKYVDLYGTQCFMATTEHNIFVCFRGTEVDQWRDIIADLLGFQIEWIDPKARIHYGFAQALDCVWGKDRDEADPGTTQSEPGLPRVLRQLREDMKDGATQPRERRVWITGHSLGGALATLAADRVIRAGILKPSDIGGVFTFGQPRVGNGPFARGYPLHDRHFRFVNGNDVVTRVPPRYLMNVALLLKLWGEKMSLALLLKLWGEKMLYRDVGNVVFVNRSSQMKLYRRETSWRKLHRSLWRRLQLSWGRAASRFGAPFARGRGHSLIQRFLPGLSDHRMGEYNRALGTRTGVADPIWRDSDTGATPSPPPHTTPPPGH
jgi:hypothetical protein